MKQIMNQDFTEKKSSIYLKKKFVQRLSSEKKNSCTSSEQNKKFLQPENSPPPPITFLMVRPLLANEAQFFRLRVFFRACSLQTEVGDPPLILPFWKK